MKYKVLARKTDKQYTILGKKDVTPKEIPYVQIENEDVKGHINAAINFLEDPRFDNSKETEVELSRQLGLSLNANLSTEIIPTGLLTAENPQAIIYSGKTANGNEVTAKLIRVDKETKFPIHYHLRGTKGVSYVLKNNPETKAETKAETAPLNEYIYDSNADTLTHYKRRAGSVTVDAGRPTDADWHWIEGNGESTCYVLHVYVGENLINEKIEENETVKSQINAKTAEKIDGPPARDGGELSNPMIWNMQSAVVLG